MKRIIFIFSIVVMTSACADYLDVLPEGTPELGDIFKTEEQANKFLSTCYNYIPNIAGYRPMPDFCAGGDVMTGWVGAVRWYPYKSLLYNEESATLTYFGMWNTSGNPEGCQNYDVFKGIRYCYISHLYSISCLCIFLPHATYALSYTRQICINRCQEDRAISKCVNYFYKKE